MPKAKLVFYQNEGVAPALEWLNELRATNERAYAKCRVRLQRLAELGHELRRPEADYLRDDIYELRSRLGTVNYRLLYFFHGRGLTIVSHGCTKEDQVPNAEINLAIARRKAFMGDPAKHTYERDIV
jgi:phage-related protein